MIEILPFGDSALLVNFEQKIDEAINAKVIAMHNDLQSHPFIHYIIPAYCSLTIGFDREKISQSELSTTIQKLYKGLQTQKKNNHSTIEIPVCYEAEFAPDMNEVEKLTGLTAHEIIEQHTSTQFRVYMLGFVAGFAYLGSLPDSLICPRKQQPRKAVEEGSVGLAGSQTGIYPSRAPGGWQIIGRTPITTFNPKSEHPSLFQPGDWVKFKPISKAEFEKLKAENEQGIFNTETLHG